MSTQQIPLPGLDGSNPLAFMAALGTLRILDEQTSSRDDCPVPRLSWRNDGRWIPVMHGYDSLERIIEAVMADRETWKDEPALNFAYSKDGLTQVDASTSGAIQKLKPSPSLLHRFLDQLAIRASKGNRRSADLFASFATETATNRAGTSVKPTALDFTTGKQSFLKMALELVGGSKEPDLYEALEGPWKKDSSLPSMCWDSTDNRNYALRASDPSKRKTGVPGANWLAIRSLPFFLLAPTNNMLNTSCISGGWNDKLFTWPIWKPPASRPTLESLLHLKSLPHLTDPTRYEYGICVVFQSSIRNYGNAEGYGSFTPAQSV